MALNIGDNFSYAGAKPLDNRQVVASKAALDAVALSTVYEGMVVYAASEDKYYRLKDGAWVEFSTGSASLPVATASTLGGIKVGNGLEIKSDGTLSATASPDNSVVAWTAGDSYEVGQYVVYDNNMYECITANSDSTFDADKWQLIGESSSEIKITDWKSGTSYSAGDLVLYNYTLYQCTTANSDSTFDETNWTAIGNVDEGISEWVSGTSYSAGNIVIYDSKIYKCAIANSDTTFDADKWAELGDSGNVQAWISGTSYEVDDFAIYNNRLYQCLVANSDTTFDEDNWSDLGTIQKTVETWTSGKSYSVGDIVIYGKAIYKCTTANSDATFTPFKWSVEIDNDKSVTAWVSGTSYTVGKYVVYDSRIWECTVANSDTTFTESHWQEISPATGIVLEAWATSKSYKVNQFVEHNTHAYMCLASHTSGVFATDYDNGNWRQISFDEFTGATATADGAKGIVPQPQKGDEKNFLRGDGSWHPFDEILVNATTKVLWEGNCYTVGDVLHLSDDYTNYDYIIGYTWNTEDITYAKSSQIYKTDIEYPNYFAIDASSQVHYARVTYSGSTATVYDCEGLAAGSFNLIRLEGIKLEHCSGLYCAKDTLWTGGLYASNATATLSAPYTDYDYLIFYMTNGDNAITGTGILTPDKSGVGIEYTNVSGTRFVAYVMMKSSTQAKLEGMLNLSAANNRVTKIEGIRFNRSPEEYSTTERRIGTWIDGKPLYQVTVTGTTPSTTGEAGEISLVDLGATYNVKQVVDISGYLLNSNGACWSINTGSSYTANVRMRGDKNLAVFVDSDALSFQIFVTIKYTKTTD